MILLLKNVDGVIDMKRFLFLIWCRIRRWYWKLYSLPFWNTIQHHYRACFKKKQRSYDMDSNSYNFLFLLPKKSYDVSVDKRVWSRATKKIKEDYRIPDHTSLKVLSKAMGDYYKDLFSNPLPMFGIYVDGYVWSPIKDSLPDHYIIPDPASSQIFETMAADTYNYLFASHIPARGVIVDSKVMKNITAVLPKNYILPDDTILNILKNIERKVDV